MNNLVYSNWLYAGTYSSFPVLFFLSLITEAVVEDTSLDNLAVFVAFFETSE